MSWEGVTEVVALVRIEMAGIRKGDVLPLLGVKIYPCRCKDTVLNVGIKPRSAIDSCNRCGSYRTNTDGIWWLHEAQFAPFEYDKQAIEALLENTNVEMS